MEFCYDFLFVSFCCFLGSAEVARLVIWQAMHQHVNLAFSSPSSAISCSQRKGGVGGGEGLEGGGGGGEGETYLAWEVGVWEREGEALCEL